MSSQRKNSTRKGRRHELWNQSQKKWIQCQLKQIKSNKTLKLYRFNLLDEFSKFSTTVQVTFVAFTTHTNAEIIFREIETGCDGLLSLTDAPEDTRQCLGPSCYANTRLFECYLNCLHIRRPTESLPGLEELRYKWIGYRRSSLQERGISCHHIRNQTLLIVLMEYLRRFLCVKCKFQC